MSKLKRDLKEEDIPRKVMRGEEIITACTGNAAIGTVATALTAFTTANTKLGADAGLAIAAQAEATRLVGIQNNSETAWNTAYETLLGTVEANTQGDRDKMRTTTVETYEPGRQAALGPPTKVLNVAVTLGDQPGEQEVTWDGNRPKPAIYKVRMCEDPFVEATMQEVGTPTGSRFVKGGLTAGKKYWWQVCAVGSGNQCGPWSDPATGMAI